LDRGSAVDDCGEARRGRQNRLKEGDHAEGRGLTSQRLELRQIIGTVVDSQRVGLDQGLFEKNREAPRSFPQRSAGDQEGRDECPRRAKILSVEPA